MGVRPLTEMVQPTARSLRTTAAVVLLTTWLAAFGVAHAEPSAQETIAKVVELNREGIAQYQKKHFDAARKVLKEALELCDSAGLDHHPVAARTHIHLGIVIVAGFGQREIGGRQFSEALQIDPNITLTPGLATPVVQDVFNEAVVAVSSRGATTAATPSAPAEPSAPSDAPPSAGAPADDNETPHPISMKVEDDASRVERRAPTKRSDDDDDAAAPGLASRVQLAALVGGGVGWASGTADLNADTPVTGSFAAAKLGHVALEGGYWLTNELMLSLEGRFQMVTGPTVVEANNRTYQPAKYATAVFAQGTWSPALGRLRPFLSGAVGAGKIRHVVTLPSLKDCGTARNQVCVDTVGAGPLLAGVGGGLTFDLGTQLALVAAINTQLGAPDFTFNVDFNAGLAFRL